MTEILSGILGLVLVLMGLEIGIVAYQDSRMMPPLFSPWIEWGMAVMFAACGCFLIFRAFGG